MRTEGVRIIKTPVRAPRANAFAERWVRTFGPVPRLDVIAGRHLEQVMRTYAAHFNRARPHRGLDLRMPEPRLDPAPWPDGAQVRTRKVLEGPCMSTNPLLEAGS